MSENTEALLTDDNSIDFTNGTSIELTEAEVHIDQLEPTEVDNNKVRSFSMYKTLEKPLIDFLTEGDGVTALPVFEEEFYPDAELVDCTLINLIKFIGTAFGRGKLPQAFKIVERMHEDNSAKRTLRFRSKHPLYTDGTPKYQNVCLVSGMVHLGIPILPYFDGLNVLEEDGDPDEYLALLRAENPDLF